MNPLRFYCVAIMIDEITIKNSFYARLVHYGNIEVFAKRLNAIVFARFSKKIIMDDIGISEEG